MVAGTMPHLLSSKKLFLITKFTGPWRLLENELLVLRIFWGMATGRGTLAETMFYCKVLPS